MKKFYAIIMGFVVMFALIACDIPPFEDNNDDEGRVCVVYYDGVCMAYTTIPEATPAEDGLSAYELAVQEGYEGTLDEWLLSLVGTDGEDGEDGICSECIDDNITEPLGAGIILMTFTTEENLTDVKIGHTLDGYLVSLEDVYPLDDNGTYTIEGNVTVEEVGVHMVGLTFDISEPVDPVEPIDPVDPIDPPLVE